MEKIRKQYYDTIKKHGAKGTLEMYRDSKIELNNKEWDNLHKRIKKEEDQKTIWQNPTIIAFISCCIVVLIVSIFANVDNHEKIKKCNELKGHTCSRYEIESLGD